MHENAQLKNIIFGQFAWNQSMKKPPDPEQISMKDSSTVFGIIASPQSHTKI